MNTVAVIDFGMGNLHSVAKALETAAPEVKVLVTSVPEQIRAADRVVLPGVGAMRDCMGEIKRLGLDEVIYDVIRTKPFLGVCVGMQALLDQSEENEGVTCLGVFPGTVKAFARPLYDLVSSERLKVPHMGWNRVHQMANHPLWRNIPQGERFYFVHSYYAQPDGPDPIAASTDYGHAFASALYMDNVFAVQFHPEKSHKAGLMLYSNFVHWNGQS